VCDVVLRQLVGVFAKEQICIVSRPLFSGGAESRGRGGVDRCYDNTRVLIFIHTYAFCSEVAQVDINPCNTRV